MQGGVDSSDETQAPISSVQADDARADRVEVHDPFQQGASKGSIMDIGRRDIALFLKEGESVFGDIRKLLDQHFQRLSELEQELMYWLAIEREAISLDTLQKDLVRPESQRGLLEAIGSLHQRCMIEITDTRLFTLQPVIMAYFTNRLIEQISEEIETEKIRLFASYSLMKAQGKDYVRDTQARLILTPVMERLLSSLGKEGIEKKLKNMLAALRGMPPNVQGYAAGNIVNLLVHLGSYLHSYDFSRLIIRQAYLPDVNLFSTNFAYANLATSVFSDTFGSILSTVFSPDGELLATGTARGEIRLWQATSATPLYTYYGHTDWVRSVAFSPDGRLLASGSEDQSVRLWEVNTGQLLKTLQGHTNWIWSVAFSPDGRLLASGNEDRTIQLWEVSTSQCLNTLAGDTNRVRSVVFSPDGRLLASGGDGHSIYLWEVGTGQHLKTLQGGHTHQIRSVAFSPDGRLLASGSDDQTVRLWEVDTGKLLKTLQSHTHQIRSVVFRPDGRTIASGSADGTINLWEVQTGVCWKTLKSASPYQGMNIINVKGLTGPQKDTLKALGAVEEYSQTYKPPSAFPQVDSIISEGLKQSVIRALSMLNEEEVDLGLLSLSRDFENTLKTYLSKACEKGQVQIPVKDPPERWKLASMIDWARNNRIITDKTALNFLRQERNNRAHEEMPSLEERQLFMKNIEFFAGLYIDYIKFFDDRLNAL